MNKKNIILKILKTTYAFKFILQLQFHINHNHSLEFMIIHFLIVVCHLLLILILF